MKKFDFGKLITVVFKTSNGNIWEECHYETMRDMWEKDPQVYEIRTRDTDEIIYRRTSQ